METGSSETSIYIHYIAEHRASKTRRSFPKAYKDRGTALGILISVLDRLEWSDSRPALLTPGERATVVTE